MNDRFSYQNETYRVDDMRRPANHDAAGASPSQTTLAFTFDRALVPGIVATKEVPAASRRVR